MGTSVETMWVGDEAQLHATVQSLLTRGGVVQAQAPGAVTVFVAKKLNVPVLVIGLLLCGVPGLVYLLWYAVADQDQQVTVQVGRPPQIRTEHQLWPGEAEPNRTAGPVPGAAAGPPAPPPPLPPTAPPAEAPTVLSGPHPVEPLPYPGDAVGAPRPETPPTAPAPPASPVPPVPDAPLAGWPPAGPTHEAGNPAAPDEPGRPPAG